MAVHLAQIELLVVFLLMLCLAMLDTVVPRAWALAAAALVTAEAAALHAMQVRPVSVVDDSHGLHGFADAVGVIIVPALTAGLFLVVFWYLARANAHVRARLRHRQRQADRLRRSGGGGCLHDGQLDRR